MTMMTHPATERLSAYLDGELGSEERLALDAHLATCPECRDLLKDLRRVLARAQALEDRAPRTDLWPGVAAAIGARPRRGRRVTLPLPALLAAGLALMALSGGAVALLLRSRAPAALALPATLSQAPEAPAVIPAEAQASPGYDLAVRELEGELTAGREHLDSVTVRVVEEKLALIDRAIRDAERALAADPANAYLHGHLTRTRMRKLDLLRRAAALTHAVS
jgi:Putative zinc-finger